MSAEGGGFGRCRSGEKSLGEGMVSGEGGLLWRQVQNDAFNIIRRSRFQSLGNRVKGAEIHTHHTRPLISQLILANVNHVLKFQTALLSTISYSVFTLSVHVHRETSQFDPLEGSGNRLVYFPEIYTHNHPHIMLLVASSSVAASHLTSNQVAKLHEQLLLGFGRRCAERSRKARVFCGYRKYRNDVPLKSIQPICEPPGF